jgi:hypothetical protein
MDEIDKRYAATPLELYKRVIEGLPPHPRDNRWLVETLAKYRGGDEQALRDISGCLLRIPLRIAEAKWRADSGVHILDLVQEGNRAIVASIRSFKGSRWSELEHLVEDSVNHAINLILEHPGLCNEQEDSQ